MLQNLVCQIRYYFWEKTTSRKKIKVFLSDIDGVLTDGGMYYSEQGDELKKFQVHDGMGFNILSELHIKTGFITAESRELNFRRSQKLNLDFYFSGEKNKIARVHEICKLLSIGLDEVAYIGDDVNDLQVLSAVGYRACPDNARPEVKSIPGIYKTRARGGEGAVREWIDVLKKAGRL